MALAVIVLLVLAVGVVALVAWPLVRERTVEMTRTGCRSAWRCWNAATRPCRRSRSSISTTRRAS